MEKEIWKDIPGYEGYYQASTLGRIKSLDRVIILENGGEYIKEGQMQKLQYTKKGYKYKILHKNGKRKKYFVHRLVLMTFVGECPDGYVVCHTDSNKENNRLDNLRYDTPFENEMDKYRCDSSRNSVIEKVLDIRKLYKTGEYLQNDLAKKFNMTQDNISRIVNHKTFSWVNDDGTIKEK